VLTINIATFGLMVLAAWKGRSTSLLSGALDNFGDALTYALSLAVVGATLAAQSRVAVVKGLLIMGAALAVAIQIGYRLVNPTVPVFETMGIAGLLNLGANAVCLALLTPYRRGDVNMASAWECSRNDIIEGFAVLAAAGAVGVFGAGWPDLLIAVGLLALFIRSSIRVLREAVKGLRPADHGEGPGRVQDPVCKCWVDPNRALSALHGGRTYHFCAPGCLRAFRAEPGAYIPRPGALPVMKG
jgi:Co/Zn/Cd efflux system component/YHS domain-containing protein